MYAAVFVALAAAGDSVRALLPVGLALIPTALVSGPHYGATILRVYERTEDRRRYRFFAVWTTLVLGAAFVWGLRDLLVGSWLVTLYLTWSPWHYAGQNFGVAMMFLRRRGIAVSSSARSLLWWSFALSFALTFLAIHGESPNASYAPDDFAQTALRLQPLGIPARVTDVAMLVVGAAYVVCTIAAFLRLRGSAARRDLLPPAAIVLSQALWFSVPTLARNWQLLGGIEPFSVAEGHYAFLWIGFAHSAQYLWITSYYAVRSGGTRRHLAFYGRSLVTGAALWTLPAFLFAPRIFGRLTYDAGLALMVSAFVNLHHFVLDGAIWKLRDGKIAKILLGPAAQPSAEVRHWRAMPWIAAIGGACLVVTLAAALETEIGFNRAIARGDVARADVAARRLSWIGRDGAEMHRQIADRASDAGELALARRHFDAAIALEPTAWEYVGLGRSYAQSSDWTRAGEAFDRALALDPDHPVALLYAGVVAFETGHQDEGRELVRRARSLATDADVRREIADVALRYRVE